MIPDGLFSLTAGVETRAKNFLNTAKSQKPLLNMQKPAHLQIFQQNILEAEQLLWLSAQMEHFN